MTTPIKIIKKPSPFNADPHNNRGGKGGKKGSQLASGSFKGVKKSNIVTLKKGGSGGDR